MKKISKTRERLTGEDREISSALFNRHMAAYLFCLKYVKNNKVLELGCSDGYGSSVLAGKAKSVTAADIDKGSIAEARSKYRVKGLSFVHKNALSIVYKNKFDVVISFQVIEHMADVDLYLTNINKALKKDGIFIVSTPNRVLRLYNGQKPWNKFHIKEYERHELKDILKKHFSKVEILGVHAKPEIFNTERRRLLLRRLIARFDLFHAYEKLPRGLADLFLDMIRKRPKNENVSGTKDFWISSNNLDRSLDLFAICRK